MESVAFRTFHHSPTPFLSLSSFSKPLSLNPNSSLKPFSPKPSLSLRASAKSSPSSPAPKTLEKTLSSFIKPTFIALTAAAAVFLSRHHKPSLAAVDAPAAPQSETLPSSETITDAEKETTLEEYLDSHPDDIRAFRALMELKVKSGEIEEAIGIVDRLILLEPGEKDLPLLKAHLQSYSGDTEAAKQGFEELLSQDPLLVEAYHGLVMAQRETDEELDSITKRVENAMEMCKKEKRKQDFRDFKLLVAQIRVIAGKYEDALKIYQELVKEEPRDYRPYLCQGIIYTLLRRKDEAEKQFQKYRRLVPKGHPYAQYFDDNVTAMKVFAQMEENKGKGPFKS